MQVIANGQLAASATALTTAGSDHCYQGTFCNTSGSTTETVVLTIAAAGGTQRREHRFVLAPNEWAKVPNIVVGANDVLYGTTTNASTVDYTLKEGAAQVANIQTFDANGVVKSATAVAATNTLTVGASTAAAGSTYADAGALPAATGGIYPTTAADGTKGVIISTSDQVTGRTLIIGNGVSNAVLKVYGPAGATINGGSANAAFSSASGKGVTIVCLSGSGNTWLAS